MSRFSHVLNLAREVFELDTLLYPEERAELKEPELKRMISTAKDFLLAHGMRFDPRAAVNRYVYPEKATGLLAHFADYDESVDRTLHNPEKEAEPEKFFIACMALGLTGEAGEVADLLKKQLWHTKEPGKYTDKLANELGDVLWYVTALAHLHGLSLSDVASANVRKLTVRFPEGFTSAAEARVDVVRLPEKPIACESCGATYDINPHNGLCGKCEGNPTADDMIR